MLIKEAYIALTWQKSMLELNISKKDSKSNKQWIHNKDIVFERSRNGDGHPKNNSIVKLDFWKRTGNDEGLNIIECIESLIEGMMIAYIVSLWSTLSLYFISINNLVLRIYIR